ncbi:hypothetical protein SAMN05444407_104263 [Chryseobacterium contaminans]|uniref:Uncharacterized protein n=1 Tax=Chryseobacterium contaminans TaxID=1423959 RepID=A0A1M7B8E4_9FLAO|nr:hypothetical protein SAMN05444407_104263 [Chryseobacterium contaminans]
MIITAFWDIKIDSNKNLREYKSLILENFVNEFEKNK